MQIYGCEIPIIFHHSAKISGHRYCGSRDICFECVTGFRKPTWLKGHVVIWIGALRHKLPTATFGAHRYCGSRNKIALFYHVILQNYVTKSSNNFKDGSLST